MPSPLFDHFDTIFSLVSVFILVVLAIVVIALVRGGARALAQKRRDDASPVVTTGATVVNKRDETVGGGETMASTLYYVTFETPDGQRIELRLDGPASGLLAVGDRGMLTHQGSRYQGFTRSGGPTPLPGYGR